MEQEPKTNQPKIRVPFKVGQYFERLKRFTARYELRLVNWGKASRTRLLLLAGIFIAAIVLLILLISRLFTPTAGESLLSRAQTAYNNGQYTESVPLLRQELQSNPANNPARLLLGQSLIKLRRWPEAGAALNEALKAEPQNSQILYWIGRGQFNAENFSAAENTWRIILSRTDKETQLVIPRAQFGLGELRFRQGQFDESSQLLYEALSNYTRLDVLEQQKGFYLYGLLLARNLRLGDGLDSLQKAAKVSLPINEANNIPQKASYRQASEKINGLLEHLPEVNTQRIEAARRAKLGYAFILVEEYVLAEEQFIQVLKIAPKYAEARAYLGLVYWRTGRTERAFTTFQTALLDTPESRLTRQLLAEFLLERLPGQPAGSSLFRADAELARELIDKLVTESPRDPALQILLGRYFMVARADYQSGVKYYEAAAGFNRDKPVQGLNPNALLARYYAESNVNPCVLGVDSGLAATRELPADAESWFAAGQAYRLCGHAKLAIPMFEKGIELQPYRTDLLYNLGLSYDMLGQRTEADRFFRVLANLDPAGSYFRAASR